MSTNPVELLQKLIRFDTTNPPDHTADCIGYLEALMREAGLSTTILAKSSQSPNLIARLPGRGEAPPFLLYGHVDVVTTANQQWSHPPFAGEIVDGYLWGRGALDMKGGVAMMAAALLRLAEEGIRPAGDLLFVAVSDEEAGGNDGAKFLVEEHADLFEGVRYAIGEFGGFTLHLGGKRFYPIQVSEKGLCHVKVSFRGQAGHGSVPIHGGAMAKLANFLLKLDRRRLPVHITSVVRTMTETMAENLGGMSGFILRQLLNPRLTDRLISGMGDRAVFFDPLLHNTVSPTILHGSEKLNVIPAEVSVELDGRLLPGQSPDNLVAELRSFAGEEAIIEVVSHDPVVPPEPDMGLFGLLGDILRKLDPEAIPVPLLLSGATDARFFSRIGIQTYGYLPMRLPEDFNFVQTIHAANERVPLEALHFGTHAIYDLLRALSK